MGIVFNGGVINSGGTPQAITGVIANIPAATSVAEGTIYISTDTQEIFSAQAGSWINVSGGGGGSQTLSQVLTIGNNADNQRINFDNVSLYSNLEANDNIYYFNLINNGNAVKQSGFSLSGSDNTNIYIRNLIGPTGNGNDNHYFEHEATLNKNQLQLVSDFFTTLGIQQFFKIECVAGTMNRITVIYSDGNNNVNNEITTICESANVKTEYSYSDIGLNQKTTISSNSIQFFENGVIQLLNPSVAGFGNTTVNLPEYTGVISNTNERILGNNVDLSLSTQNVDNYGVYRIITGSNSNFLNFDNFISAVVDGCFVTLLVADTPVKCQNNLGNIIGTANINSKGLYKIMRYGTDIYSSHI
jgi:hypothetical protein